MKKKKRTSSLKSLLTGSRMKRKKRPFLKSSSQQMVDEETYSYLPDDCWEIIFRFINNDDINSLSLVSKYFLSITNRLRSSLTVRSQTRPFLDILLKRFTGLTSLDFTHIYGDADLDVLLRQISNFPLKLTSLKLPTLCDIPKKKEKKALQAFAQNITTLTSLTCSKFLFSDKDLPLIADCFPLLKQLNILHPWVFNKTNFIKEIQYLLSKCPCLQHLELSRTYFENDHVHDLSLFPNNLVSINLSLCSSLTESALFSLVRNCPSLSEIRMECTAIGTERVADYNSSNDVCVYPQLKFLYLGGNSDLSDKHIILFASIFPNLEMLDLHSCPRISEGISKVLMRCCKIRHLNLTNCSGLLELFLTYCYHATEQGVKHVVENLKQLRNIVF